MKIVADDKIPFLKGVLEPFSSMVYLPGNSINYNDVKDADAIITRSITKCNASLLKGSDVKFIASATIGDDHIDKSYCAQNKIVWTNAKGCNAGGVEQYIASVLINLAAEQKIDLKVSTIGIIGVGNIGKRIKRVAEILGLRVLLNDPPRAEKEKNHTFFDLPALIEQSDIITIHVPLSFEDKYKTFHLADEDFFATAKNCKIFINSSRGEVVETRALKKAITNKKMLAVLDVWENEPNIDPELAKEVVYGTPHIAGYSIEGKSNGTAMCVNAISQFFGLGLNDWFPDLDRSGSFNFSIDCKGKLMERILQEAYNTCYNIRNDNNLFKQNFDLFEDLRRNYKFRWEPANFSIELKNDEHRPEISEQLTQLGFKIFN